MKRLLVRLYLIIPKSVKNYLGKISWLGFLRNIFLMKQGTYREVSTIITKHYDKYRVCFEYYGSIKDVTRAIKQGIENIVLKNSLKLINNYKNHNNDCVICDVGANFGYLSLVWASSICKNNGKLIAFEPNPNVYRSFLRSITKNNLSKIITLENKAVGLENSMIELYLDNTTSNTLRNLNAKDIIEVVMVSLDTYFEQNNVNRCDLIKIDVDGIELDILEGSVNTMLHLKPIFIVETNNDTRIIKFFREKNYKILNMNLEEYVNEVALPPNIFCVPN